jgi:hypothetical protein
MSRSLQSHKTFRGGLLSRRTVALGWGRDISVHSLTRTHNGTTDVTGNSRDVLLVVSRYVPQEALTNDFGVAHYPQLEAAPKLYCLQPEQVDLSKRENSGILTRQPG